MDQNLMKTLADVEKDLVNQIVKNLTQGELDAATAKAEAREFLSHMPPQNYFDLLEVLHVLSERYKEARAVYFTQLKIQQESLDREKIHTIAGHIQSGDIDSALAVVKGGAQNA